MMGQGPTLSRIDRPAGRGRAPWCVVPFCLCLAMVLGPVAAVPAAAQERDLRPLLDRLDRMQRELNTLQRQVYRGQRPPPGAAPFPAAPQGVPGGSAERSIVAKMQVRLDEFEFQMRNFTGKLEELSHNINQLRVRVDKLVADVDFRLNAIEKRQAAGQPPPPGAAGAAVAAATPGGPEGGPESQPPGAKPGVLGTIPAGSLGGRGAAAPSGEAETPPSPPPLPPGSPEEQYNFARLLLVQHDFAGAERALRAFVAAHPDHRLTGNAQYWLGETFYVRKDFTEAAKAFAEGYRRFPESKKGPDNLLKLGLSLASLGRKEDACATFARLEKEFPKAPANVRGRADAEQKRNGC